MGFAYKRQRGLRRGFMNSFIAAVVVAVGLAVAAYFVLNAVQTPADHAYTTQGVRL
jgi:hypothetical protein